MAGVAVLFFLLPLSLSGYIKPIFVGAWSDCRNSANQQPRVPEVENGWYFFRDDQAEGDAQWDDSAYRVRASWNYTAAVYDSENHVLYLFELDT